MEETTDALGNNWAISVIIVKMSMENRKTHYPLSWNSVKWKLKPLLHHEAFRRNSYFWGSEVTQEFWQISGSPSTNEMLIHSKTQATASVCWLSCFTRCSKTDNFFLNAQKSQSRVIFNLNPISKHSRAWVCQERRAEKEVPSSFWVDRGELFHLFSFLILQFLLLNRLDLKYEV